MGRFYIHLIQWASVFGAALSFLFGASIFPRLLATYLWTARHVPWSQITPGPFPNLTDPFSSLDVRFGLIWLAYYIVAYLWSVFGPLHWRFLHHRSISSETQASRGWPGEQKWILVERCYQKYREALKRYDPQPLLLKTPPGFYYRKGTPVTWEGSTLILPEELLTPEHIHLLLPLLAQKLAYYNSSEWTLQMAWEYLPNHSQWWLTLTGNFLWLSVLVKRLIPWNQWNARRVHDADTFAHYIGEGASLEHYLRRCLAAVERAGRPDHQVPSLIERIGHLEALQNEEHEQMRKIGLVPQEPPLMTDPPVPRLK